MEIAYLKLAARASLALLLLQGATALAQPAPGFNDDGTVAVPAAPAPPGPTAPPAPGERPTRLAAHTPKARPPVEQDP
ncbi:MAG: hypothetical protein KJ062_04340, partial [Thermoanaerobaculia bacterium]|nr:hypothetical protein [Thermoanaerobaculia bacterium]